MKHNKSNIVDEEMLNKIISVAYGDASLKDRLSVFAASKQNEEVQALLAEYRATAESVHDIGVEECPEELLSELNVKNELKNRNEKSFLFDLYRVYFSRPLVSAVATIVVLIAMISSIVFSERTTQQVVSQSEIELANNQVKYALSIVRSAFDKSNKILKEDILKDKVAEPIGEGINYVNTLLTEDK